MVEPFSEASQQIAEDLTATAIRVMIDAGLSPLEVAHSLIHAGLDFMPAAACAECLEGEYYAVLDAVEDRIDGIGDLLPGVDVAMGCVH
jgi:hypothetical protein